ncbi:hypothetical protein J4Q44_G00090100 [Coregonus suidteri]|uniref:Uncharacterized protein n=1 Tax=Coregonus suidteri TaxID=861788 RepID=A0AAN8LW84_9TELE
MDPIAGRKYDRISSSLNSDNAGSKATTTALATQQHTVRTRDVQLCALPNSSNAVLSSRFGEAFRAKCVTKSIAVNNVQYNVGDYLVIDTVHSEEIPVFMEVCGIYSFLGAWVVKYYYKPVSTAITTHAWFNTVNNGFL